MTSNLSIETESTPTANPVMAQPFDVPADPTMLSSSRKARRQRALLARCATMPTLIDTRTVPDGIDCVAGYEGAFNREHGETREERDLVPAAAWGNALSFRHTEASLLRLVRDCGYAKMMQMRPAHRRNYTFYLCLPHPEKSAKRMVAKNQRGPQREDRAHGPDAGAL